MKNMKLPQFIEKLKKCESIHDYINEFESDLVRAINFRDYANFSVGKYTRNLLYTCESFELMLVCWGEGQKSSIHDHSDSECIMSCVDGALQENLYSNTNEGIDFIKSTNLDPYVVININNEMGIHEILNNNKLGSLSLHLYSPPISSFKAYSAASNQPINVESQFSTIFNYCQLCFDPQNNQIEPVV